MPKKEKAFPAFWDKTEGEKKLLKIRWTGENGQLNRRTSHVTFCCGGCNGGAVEKWNGVCCNRKRRDFFNQTRQSKEMKESAREDLIGIGMIINNDTGSFEEMHIKDTVKDTIVLREYLQYEIPLTNNSIEELIDMDKETGLEWNLKRLKI